MFKLWGKMIKDNKMIKHHTAQIDETGLSEEQMLDMGMEEICKEFDIQKPVWFPLHKRDYATYGRTIFKADAFMEGIDFDEFEIEVIQEDKKR